MEHRLLSDVGRGIDQNPSLSSKSTDAIISLITNPFSSDQTINSLLETLILHLQNPSSNHHKTLSLLFALSRHHPPIRHRIAAAANSFILLPSTPTPSIQHALSLIDPANPSQPDPFSDESIFLSLCFWQCVKIRGWVLRNVCKFRVRPSVLITVLLGFTKDPYPDIRGLALDALAMLSDVILIEDQSLLEGCYFRAVELLFDAENYVRHSAVCAVSDWGQLLVASSSDETIRDRSDALFVQLSLMVRDTDMEIRVAAFNALGKLLTVSEDILLQTLSKKALLAIKEKNYTGQYTAKQFKIPASTAAFIFVHGLEDEFYQVRRSACHALQTLVVFSAKFAGRAVCILMDILNDNSVVVRLQALESLQHMAVYGHLKVEESNLHMLVGALFDNSALVRSAARKTLLLTKLQNLAMFRSCIDGLIKNLELHPQEEADIFHTLFKVGQTHGKFVIRIIHEVSQELEPSFDGKLVLNTVRRVALFVLAVSAPVSIERKICSIPPQLFSYAVTLLGRLSRALVGVMDQNILLAYLSHCSTFTVASSSEIFGGEVLDFNLKDGYINVTEKGNEVSLVFPESLEPKNVITSSPHDYLLNANVKASRCIEIVFRKVVDLWPLIHLGYMKEVVHTLRNWKEELMTFSGDSGKPAGILVFAMEYLCVIKLLGKAWSCFSHRNLQFKRVGFLEAMLGKMERRLKEMLYRFPGLSRKGKLHILELMLVNYTMRFSYEGTCCFEYYMKKVDFVLSSVENLQKEGSIELSIFAIELQNILCEIGNSEDGFIHKLDLFQKSLQLFSLRCILLPEELEYLEAGVDVRDNDFQNPFLYISGIPVGLPLNITLYNIASETRLWVVITLGEKSTQFVFLDLHEFGGSDAMRRFSFVAPFYRTPKATNFVLKVSIAMECLREEDRHFKPCNSPRHELMRLSEEKDVHLSMAVE